MARLDVTQDMGNGLKVRYLGPFPLTAFDLRLLQGLVALAGPRGRMVNDPVVTGDAKQRLALLEAATPNVMVPVDTGETLYIHESYARVAAEIGMRAQKSATAEGGHYGGYYATTIRASLERMFATSILVDNNGERAGFRLISKLATSARRNELWVLLNPRLSAAIAGGPHARIDMDEVRALQSDAARLIHQRLCTLVFPGETRPFQLSTMIEWIYVGEEVSDRAMRKRLSTVRGAMEEIASLGWTCQFKAKPQQGVTVSRPLRRDNLRKSSESDVERQGAQGSLL